MATRVGGVLAIIGPIRSGCGPDILCGELRTDDGQPWQYPRSVGGVVVEHTGIRVAPNTGRGLGLILAGLQRLVDTRPVHPARRTG